MTFINPFIPGVESYKRDIQPIKHYVSQAASYLHIETGKPLNECEAFVRNGLKNKRFENVRDPKVKFLKRQENGDRVMEECGLIEYINETVISGELLAPTMTTYLPTSTKKSVLMEYIDDNVKKRGVAKKAMFAAEARGDKITEFFEDINQRNTKLSNNAISGAHASASTPLYNQTSHSTLTSNCRLTSGYGNANNEKLLSGNRHYWAPDIVINNIISITNNTDYKLLESVMEKYNLHYPTVEEADAVIHYSSELYWRSKKYDAAILSLLSKLTPIQRASFVYTGDLYHVMKFNNDFMKDFISKLSSKAIQGFEGNLDFDEKSKRLAQIKDIGEDYMNLAHQICAEEMKGRGKDYFKMQQSGAEKELRTVIATAFNVMNAITEYEDFIRMTMVSDNVPASVSHFPNSIRRSALTSDTDSTIFTVQDWVIWFKGTISFDAQAIAVASTMIFLASQAIVHVLARMSVNAGFEKDRTYQVAMKNEFFFPIFIPTKVAKHYFAIISCQEGNVYDKLKTEIKGVHLKSSNAPKKLTKAAADLMYEIMTTVYEGKKISLAGVLKKIADIERGIYSGIATGDKAIFRLAEIKTPESYTKEKEQSPYFYHMFWEQTFASKYGSYGEPPYQALRLSTTLDNHTNLALWLANMEDKELSAKIDAFLKVHNKARLPSLQIPSAAVMAHGMPVELQEAINSRKIVSDLSKVFYLIMETIGYYGLNRHVTNLVSDRY